MKTFIANLYNASFALGIIALVALVVRGNFTEAVVLVVLALLVTPNHSDLERRMAFGMRASLHKSESQLVKDLNDVDKQQITGSYALNLIFYLGWAAVAIFIVKNLTAGILLFVQSKLIIEQHRELPNRYVVAVSHILPIFVFFLLVPSDMATVKVFSAVTTLLLAVQGSRAIWTLNKSDRLVRQARQGK